MGSQSGSIGGLLGVHWVHWDRLFFIKFQSCRSKVDLLIKDFFVDHHAFGHSIAAIAQLIFFGSIGGLFGFHLGLTVGLFNETS